MGRITKPKKPGVRKPALPKKPIKPDTHCNLFLGTLRFSWSQVKWDYSRNEGVKKQYSAKSVQEELKTCSESFSIPKLGEEECGLTVKGTGAGNRSQDFFFSVPNPDYDSQMIKYKERLSVWKEKIAPLKDKIEAYESAMRDYEVQLNHWKIQEAQDKINELKNHSIAD